MGLGDARGRHITPRGHEHVKWEAVLHSVRAGRESLFELDPKPIADVRADLDPASRQWDAALGRLKAFVERG